jgi:hypothetical protein
MIILLSRFDANPKISFDSNRLGWPIKTIKEFRNANLAFMQENQLAKCKISAMIIRRFMSKWKNPFPDTNIIAKVDIPSLILFDFQSIIQF